MAVTPTMIQEVRYEVADLDPALPLLSDDVYIYVLTKNNENIQRSSLDAARMILLQLSLRGDSTVDIFSIKGSKVASEYRAALELYIKSPQLNPIYSNTSIYAGNISKADMKANDATVDNKIIQSPLVLDNTHTGFFTI